MTNLDNLLRSIDLTDKFLSSQSCSFSIVVYGYKNWTIKKDECWRIDAFKCGVGEDSWESLGQQGDPTSQSERKSILNIHWKDRCWSWSSNTLVIWCEDLTHWKRLWCWERMKAGGERDSRRWNGWMVSPTRWKEFEQVLGVGDGQGSLATCCSWCHKVSDPTEQLNWTELTFIPSLNNYSLGQWSYNGWRNNV